MEQIRAQTARRGLGHAYLVEGEGAAARHALAAALTQALVCKAQDGAKPCLTCAHCKKAAAGIHPDVTVVAPEGGKELKVDQMRAIRADAYIRPNEADRKVYWISDAHRMNQSAQNVLLKVLEEGPRYAAFVLEAPSGALLLPTVVSRCEGLRAAPMERELQQDAPWAQEAAQLAQLLLGEDELALAAFCVTLEKHKREDLLAIVDGAAARLTRGAPRRAVPGLLALRRCRAACERNVGQGHIAGYLAAVAFQGSGG